ncbi:hypothetical protein PIIN_07660 [Serendipita indica DSM 11827]|uniref:Uncharacterized protein n=1 Tax=Serendipita indica (strain DSM 11827) TaxID=1109443 RepID=G4TQW3_SERID|nr:hypothetical protein PIIN_07660 [Serendipita indica DSM 11827]
MNSRECGQDAADIRRVATKECVRHRHYRPAPHAQVAFNRPE